MMAVLMSCDTSVSVREHDHPLLEHTHPREQSDVEQFDEFLKLMGDIVESFGAGYTGKVVTIRGTVEGFQELVVLDRKNGRRQQILYLILKTKEPDVEFWVNVTSITERLPEPRKLYLIGSMYNFTVRIEEWNIIGGPGKMAGGLPTLVDREIETSAIISTIDLGE